MIDFHSHILPGMDDGSRDVTESLEMLRAASEQGVDVICSTSHYYARRESPDSFLKRRASAIEKLERELAGNKSPRILYGAEVQYFEGICNAEHIEALRLEGTEVFLLEMPFFRWTARMSDDVLRLNREPGTTVMLAHMERYLPYGNADAMSDLHDEGVILQSNASFFIRWGTKRKALKMLRDGLIDVIGSDCHNTTSRRQNIAEAWNIIKKKYGAAEVERIDRIGRMLTGTDDDK